MRTYLVLTIIACQFVSAPPPRSIAQSGAFAGSGKNKSGKPEHLLSGIDVSSKIEQVIAKYGLPDDVHNITVDRAPEGSGERNYVWRKGSTTVSAKTGHYLDKNGKEVESHAYEIEVAGSSAEGEIGRTGAGLSLGDTQERAEHVYGARFSKSQIYKSALKGERVPVLAIEWENGTRLCIGLDKGGRIDFITLMASVY